jgi:hypothetical protein
MYALSKLPVGEGVRPEDVNEADAALDAERRAKESERYLIAPANTALPSKKGGVVSASKRADGCAQRGKTRGKMV